MKDLKREGGFLYKKAERKSMAESAHCLLFCAIAVEVNCISGTRKMANKISVNNVYFVASQFFFIFSIVRFV